MSTGIPKSTLAVGEKSYSYVRLADIPGADAAALSRLPVSMRVLLENLARHEDGRVIKREHVEAVLRWSAKGGSSQEISFHPARVLMQDFTGVPAVVDLAAMREAVAALGGDPQRINPLVQADLVIDHSVQVDSFATLAASRTNTTLEYERNQERYVFLRWGQTAFRNFRAVPPEQGICHQVNLEFLAGAVLEKGGVVFPDTLVGTDSHTTMINGLGVVGWGVGGIEAEAAMLGQPITMLIPEVVGFKLTGTLREGATATDLVLTVTQMLRKQKVVGKFVEFFGPGLDALALTDRATIANMAPEYGATIGFFPVDAETLAYLRFSGRSEQQVALVEAYCKAQGIFREPGMPEPEFSATLELDLGAVEPSLAGPKRPQDRVPLSSMKKTFRASLVDLLPKDFAKVEAAAKDAYLAFAGPSDASDPGRAEALAPALRKATVARADESYTLRHGAVVIAAITSCTNTSNPSVMLGAGLVAKKAVERGLVTRPWVKTSLAPGSRVVTEYLREAGLMPYLEALGFHLVGYGCTTCIGNSGPLPEVVADTVKKHDLVVASVLSGNRNFEGRVNPHVRMNYLASPPLVVAYAIAGNVDLDLQHEPIGFDKAGEPVFLRDVWPTTAEVQEAVRTAVKPEQFTRQYEHALDGGPEWQALEVPKGQTFEWQESSTYVRRPPYFDGFSTTPPGASEVKGARVLALLGDSVTTDHISPAGNIAKDSPAARYLTEHGVAAADFNSYGARRGNHEVMMRGTFANIRLKNLLLGGEEGGNTLLLPSGEKMSIYDAAMRYQAAGVPLVVLAGQEYGTGSSRDWAAKGTRLLGVRAVIAKSFERIHRSNLVGMGVLPLEFMPGEGPETLGLTGRETFDLAGVASDLVPGKKLVVTAKSDDGKVITFDAKLRIDTPNEVDYYLHGGILPYVVRQIVAS